MDGSCRYMKTKEYIESLSIGIPDAILIITTSCLTLLIIATYILSSNRNSFVFRSSILILFVYVIMCMMSTVVFRETNSESCLVIKPLWSYDAILKGQRYLIVENILNILFFIPIGFLLKISFSQLKLTYLLFLCTILSFSIESLQLVFAKGVCELDDVIHNVLGGFIGFLLAKKIVS